MLIIEVQAKTAAAAGYQPADILAYLAQYGYTFHKIGRAGRLSALNSTALSDYQNILCVVAAHNLPDPTVT